VGGACDRYVGGQKCTQDFGRNPKKKRPLGRIIIYGKIILKMDLRKTGREDVDGG
jgi:hypothetical protein